MIDGSKVVRGSLDPRGQERLCYDSTNFSEGSSVQNILRGKVGSAVLEVKIDGWVFEYWRERDRCSSTSCLRF